MRLRLVLILAAFLSACAPLHKRTLYDASYGKDLALPREALRGWTILLDPGHGGPARGAVSPEEGNSPEADLNLAVSFLLGGLCEASGARVEYTRTADIDISLDSRAEHANLLRPDLFLSIHHNASDRVGPNRVEVYPKLRSGGPARAAGARILEELARLYPASETALIPGNFAVLRKSRAEGILVECAYLSRPLAADLERVSLIKLEAVAIYRGLLAYSGAPVPTVPAEAPPLSRVDSRPYLLIVRGAGLRPPEPAADTAVRVESIDEEADPVATLLAIEDRAPDLVVILRRGARPEIRHYFSSRRGKEIALSLARRLGIPRIEPASDYLLTHTSMTAVMLSIERPVATNDLLEAMKASR